MQDLFNAAAALIVLLILGVAMDTVSKKKDAKRKLEQGIRSKDKSLNN